MPRGHFADWWYELLCNCLSILLPSCAGRMAVHLHHKVELSYLLGYSATSTRTNQSRFNLLTHLSQCSSHCTTCLTDYTVTYMLKELEQWRNNHKPFLILQRISPGRCIQSVMAPTRLFCSLGFITMASTSFFEVVEHHQLKKSQLNIHTVPDADLPGKCKQYTKHGSKNCW